MVLILDGNSEHVAHAGRKKGLLYDENTIPACSGPDQMP